MLSHVPGIDQIFILHCRKGYTDREHFQTDQFNRERLPFEFILEGDISDLTPEILDEYFAAKLTPASYSCCYKHILAWKKVVDRGYERCVVFEDDIALDIGFRRALTEIVRESQSLGQDHVVYMSNAGNKYTPRSERRPGKRLYESDHSRAVDAYVITQSVARKRLAWLEKHKMQLPIDHQVNAMDRDLGIGFVWAEDPVAEQGSMTGLFRSSIENRYSAGVRRWRWQLDKFYKMHILRNLR